MSGNYLVNLVAYKLREIVRGCCYGISNLECMPKEELERVNKTNFNNLRDLEYRASGNSSIRGIWRS
jgi:hypothetical protein